VNNAPKIALLFANTPITDVMGPSPKERSAKAFLDGMRALGWLDGTNITPVFALLFSLMLYCLSHVSKNESRLSHYRCHQEPDFPRAAE